MAQEQPIGLQKDSISDRDVVKDSAPLRLQPKKTLKNNNKKKIKNRYAISMRVKTLRMR